jgi:hypothetical protein
MAVAVPPPGMFLGPTYPMLLAGLMRLDPALADGAACVVRNLATSAFDLTCPPYRGLILPLHMVCLAGAATFVFASARRLAGSGAVAVLAALFVVGSLWVYLRFLTLAMTESLALLLFAGLLHALLRLRDGGWKAAGLAGLALGVLLLTRPSHVVLALLLLACGAGLLLPRGMRRRRAVLFGAFVLGLTLPTAPWVVRNAIVLGRPALNAGYGPAVLVERLAYNDMDWGEWRRAFVFWMPDLGDKLARRWFGAAAVDRLDWNQPGSFYLIGQDRRQQMLARPGGIDAALGEILRDQVFGNPVKHAAVTLALAWNGVWIGRNWMIGVLLLAPFGIAAAYRAKRLQPVLLWMVPAWVMLFVHAGASVNQERYNLALTFGFSLLAAWGALALLGRWNLAFRGIPGIAPGDAAHPVVRRV